MTQITRPTCEQRPQPLRARLRAGRFATWLMLAAPALVLAACGDGPSSAGIVIPPGAAAPAVSAASELTIRVVDVTDASIAGATVTVTLPGLSREGITDANGSVILTGLTAGRMTVSIRATGFRSATFPTDYAGGTRRVQQQLRAELEWTLGRSAVIAARTVERASDGTTLTFSTDIGILNENADAMQTLTAADFAVQNIDCGWGGPRDCASDAAGNFTARGYFVADGPALSFAIQPAAARRPYVVGVLLERSTNVTDWATRGAALKDFLSVVGGNDLVGVATFQDRAGTVGLTPLGPFTRDGRTFLGSVDALAEPAGDPPKIFATLGQMVELTAQARDQQSPGADAYVLVVATGSMTLSEINEISTLARRSKVRIAAIDTENGNWDVREASIRSGGFAIDFADRRQFSMIFGAMDRLLSGTAPFYRMQFRIKGPAETFVPGGHAKVRIRATPPASFPNIGVYTLVDVDIP
jgi:hypothetical protein